MMPPKTGLVSISFRSLPAEEIIALVTKAGQTGIEWGGDVHVPHGDTAKARQVAELCRDAGIDCAAYGSYYRLAAPEKSPDFNAVLDTALALGAPTLRVWAGIRGSAECDAETRAHIEDDARRICALAAPHGLRIALEYHGGTLTDSADSAAAFLAALPLPNLDTLWQPPNGQPESVCENSLRQVLSRVSNIHVFNWGPRGWADRYALADGIVRWKSYFRIVAENPKPRWALLEFVKDDSPEQYLRDAASLRTCLSSDDGI